MRLSTRARYAVMAVVELAEREARHPVQTPGRVPARAASPGAGRQTPPVSLAEIAASQMLSLAYLEQLFGPMRRAGLVTSARGPGGGYRLTRPASALTVAEVVDAVEDTSMTARGDDETHRMQRHADVTDALWSELNQHIRMFLSGVTIADILAGNIAGRAVAPALTPALGDRVPA